MLKIQEKYDKKRLRKSFCSTLENLEPKGSTNVYGIDFTYYTLTHL